MSWANTSLKQPYWIIFTLSAFVVNPSKSNHDNYGDNWTLWLQCWPNNGSRYSNYGVLFVPLDCSDIYQNTITVLPVVIICGICMLTSTCYVSADYFAWWLFNKNMQMGCIICGIIPAMCSLLLLLTRGGGYSASFLCSFIFLIFQDHGYTCQLLNIMLIRQVSPQLSCGDTCQIYM